MKLKTWMAEYNYTQKSLSKDVGLTPSQICCFINGKTKPTLETAKKIVDFTKGEVSYEEIYEMSFKYEKPLEKVIQEESSENDSKRLAERLLEKIFEQFTPKSLKMPIDIEKNTKVK